MVVSDDVSKYARGAFPKGVCVHDRAELDRLQRELREIPGVSALIYDQICAAEARRLRKRGELPEPDERIVINELVCEGCGDCSVQSNCISIEPVETEFGRKRRINQSTCNMDTSCLRGYCPSFVSVIWGTPRRRGSVAADTGGDEVFADLPTPPVADAARPFNILVTGIGGSGVVTVGALLGMAAHLEGKGCSGLDVTGLAQKNGPVTSHVRIANDPEALHATRIASGAADLVLGCDIVVASGVESLEKMSGPRTTAVINTHVAPTSDFATHPDLDLSSAGMEQRIRAAAGSESHFIEATRLATSLLGDSIASNLFLLGYALQLGRIPVGIAALERAIELNGSAIAMNKRALAWGRLAAVDLESVARAARLDRSASSAWEQPSLAAIVARRVEFLTEYQDEAYARRYSDLVERVRVAEKKHDLGTSLTEAVARYYFKLLAYKDEYEVARLWTTGTFKQQLEAEFEGNYKLELHLAPQFLPRRRDGVRARSFRFGPWVFTVFRMISALRFLRGTILDPLQLMAHRRMERRLIGEYEATVAELLDGLGPQNHAIAVDIASIPEHIRGFADVKERHRE